MASRIPTIRRRRKSPLKSVREASARDADLAARLLAALREIEAVIEAIGSTPRRVTKPHRVPRRRPTR